MCLWPCFARQRQRFGSCEERGHSFLWRETGILVLCEERKEVRQAARGGGREREKGTETEPKLPYMSKSVWTPEHNDNGDNYDYFWFWFQSRHSIFGPRLQRFARWGPTWASVSRFIPKKVLDEAGHQVSVKAGHIYLTPFLYGPGFVHKGNRKWMNTNSWHNVGGTPLSSTQKHVDRKERERRQKLDLFTDIMLASDIRDCFCFMIYYYIF